MSRWGREPSKVRPTTALRDPPPRLGRCTGAAAGRPISCTRIGCSLSFTSSHSAARFRLCSTCIAQRLFALESIDAQAVSHVVEDRLGKRIGPLEHHAHAAPQIGHIQLQHVLAIQQHLAFVAGVLDGFVDAVEGSQKRGFAAAGGTDQSGDMFLGNLQVDLDAAPERFRKRNPDSRPSAWPWTAPLRNLRAEVEEPSSRSFSVILVRRP